jgi:hypothetical protein
MTSEKPKKNKLQQIWESDSLTRVLGDYWEEAGICGS